MLGKSASMSEGIVFLFPPPCSKGGVTQSAASPVMGMNAFVQVSRGRDRDVGQGACAKQCCTANAT